jgi:DNA-binding transcriptional LysR family regulator
MADLSQMKTLVLTEELGSLAKVGKKLGISPAAISKQLTKLENELGLQLLNRTTRKVELTEIGFNYYLQCKKILEEVEAASALVSKIKEVPSGTLKIVSGRHFAVTYIIPHLKEFLEKYPQIDIDLELAERIPDLNLEPIDILIGMSISATGDIVQKKIATTSYAYCASPKYLKEFGTPKKPEDLKNHRYITHSMRKPDNELEFGKKIIKLTPFIRVNDAKSMLNLALDHLGIVKLHRYVVNDALKKGLLKEILSDYNINEIPLYVAYPHRRFLATKVRCFIDFITDKITEGN